MVRYWKALLKSVRQLTPWAVASVHRGLKWSHRKGYTHTFVAVFLVLLAERLIVHRTTERCPRLVIWSSDFHISPIKDLTNLLKPLGVKVIDMSLSGACTKTCARGLRVLNRNNGMSMSEELQREFYESYKDDPEMQSVDAFVCNHPAAMCEAFMPFNKTILVIASTRYELGRFEPERWKKWNENLIKISKDPRNIVSGNNLYDAEYIRYFTGIETTVLESYCDVGESYSYSKVTRREFLLAPSHVGHFETSFLERFKKAVNMKTSYVKLEQLRSLYSRYTYSDLTHHPGIVYIPYQVSVMSLFEQYRMGIPLFFPSLDLLTEWQREHHVLNERTWDMTMSKNMSVIPQRSRIQGVLSAAVPDPNNEVDADAIKYWLKFSDFYQWPHITYYNSIEDLVDKLETTDLADISRKMKEHNVKVKDRLLTRWRSILRTILWHSI